MVIELVQLEQGQVEPHTHHHYQSTSKWAGFRILLLWQVGVGEGLEVELETGLPLQQGEGAEMDQ